MKQRKKIALVILLCICMMGTLVAHAAEARHSTIDTTEYGMMMTYVNLSSTMIYASASVDENLDGATLKVTLSAYEWYDEEDNTLLAIRLGSDSSGTGTSASTNITDPNALLYSNYLLASGAVRDGSSGKDYTDYVHWWLEE